MKVAAIDCGTNTMRLLIAQPDGAGGLDVLARASSFVRLGQGIDATGEFHPDALARAFATSEDFAALIAEHGAERVRFVATSAARDAGNRDAFFDGVQERLGLLPDVVAGTEEAELSYCGATLGLPSSPEPILVVDIGGGSTEFVLGGSPSSSVPSASGAQGLAGRIVHCASLDLGAVRLTERLFTADPVPAADWQRATALVDAGLDTIGVDLASVRTWLGVAGTHTSLAAIHLDLPSYDRDLVHHTTIPREAVIGLADRFARSDAAERAAIPTLPPKRADVIAAGSLIAARIAARVRVDLRVCESDILDGIALRLLQT